VLEPADVVPERQLGQAPPSRRPTIGSDQFLLVVDPAIRRP
jgi:hypothetical protein